MRQRSRATNNPPCIRCRSQTINIGSSGREKVTNRYLYRYKCSDNNCGKKNEEDNTFNVTEFYQVPPNELQPGEIANPMLYESRKISYKCKLCGQPKKGHVCTAELPERDNKMLSKKRKVQPLVSDNFVATDQTVCDSIEHLNNILDTSEKQIYDSGECICCFKPGTFQAGASNSLLRCTSCKDIAIHLNCMKCFTISWQCPMCSE